MPDNVRHQSCCYLVVELYLSRSVDWDGWMSRVDQGRGEFSGQKITSTFVFTSDRLTFTCLVNNTVLIHLSAKQPSIQDFSTATGGSAVSDETPCVDASILASASLIAELAEIGFCCS
jgi:hypothetical protein